MISLREVRLRERRPCRGLLDLCLCTEGDLCLLLSQESEDSESYESVDDGLYLLVLFAFLRLERESFGERCLFAEAVLVLDRPWLDLPRDVAGET